MIISKVPEELVEVPIEKSGTTTTYIDSLTVACRFLGTEALVADLPDDPVEIITIIQDVMPDLFETIGFTGDPEFDSIRALARIGIYGYLDTLEKYQSEKITSTLQSAPDLNQNGEFAVNEALVTNENVAKLFRRLREIEDPELLTRKQKAEYFKELFPLLPIKFTDSDDYYYREPNMSALTSFTTPEKQSTEEVNCIAATSVAASLCLRIGFDSSDLAVINAGAHTALLIRSDENEAILVDPSTYVGATHFKVVKYDRFELRKLSNLDYEDDYSQEARYRESLNITKLPISSFFTEPVWRNYANGAEFYDYIGAISQITLPAQSNSLSLNKLEEGIISAIYTNMGAFEALKYARRQGGNKEKALHHLKTAFKADPQNTSILSKIRILETMS